MQTLQHYIMYYVMYYEFIVPYATSTMAPLREVNGIQTLQHTTMHVL